MYAFVDTNVLLHYPPLNQVDWLSYTAQPRVTIVVAPIVVRELNRHKDKPESRKLRERAVSALRLLREYLHDPERPLRQGVGLLIQDSDPTLDFAAHQLNRDVNDDWLIASILDFKAQNPASPVGLVTEDLALIMKARPRDISLFQPPEDLRLPDEVDPIEKKLRETQDELRRLRNRLPDLCLLFSNGTDHLNVPLRLPAKITTEQTAARMTEIRTRHPKKVEGNLGGLLAEMAKEFVKGYNEQIEKFWADYERYLVRMNRFEARKCATIPIEIHLSNSGSGPGKDIHIFMHFPDGVDVYEEEDLKSKLVAPTEPKPPIETIIGNLEALKGGFAPAFSIPTSLTHLGGIRSVHSNESGWSIKKANSYDLKNHVKELTHGLKLDLEKLFIVFESSDTIRSFSIDYDLFTADLPDPISGKLHVIITIDRSETPSD